VGSAVGPDVEDGGGLSTDRGVVPEDSVRADGTGVGVAVALAVAVAVGSGRGVVAVAVGMPVTATTTARTDDRTKRACVCTVGPPAG